MRTLHRRLFGPVMFWTVLTSVFGWLPLARILGRPEGYTWGILGVSGAGTDGPYWIFVVLTAYVVALLYCAYRGPRALFYPMLLLWHLACTGVVAAGVLSGGSSATLQGQGLHFSIPLWVLLLPFLAFTALAAWWVVLDYRSGESRASSSWTRTNTGMLGGSLVLCAAALLLFRVGTNYNWVTAVAIVTTVAQWILMVQSFARGATANGRDCDPSP